MSEKKAKTIDQLEKIARELHDELCWGNKKDVGVKFLRTPLTPEKYREKRVAYYEELWVRLDDAQAKTKEIAKKIVLWIHELDETAWLPDDEDVENKVEELLVENK